MTANTFTIKEIAEKNALSAKTVQNAIKANPQLGIVMRPKVKTVLTFEQAAQLSAVLGKKKSQFSENSANESDIPRVSQKTENFEEEKISQFSETANDSKLVEELYSKIIELTERAAKAEGAVEALEAQVRDLREQREKADEERRSLQGELVGAQKLLEDSEMKAERAQADADSYRAEANSYKPSLFGFYRKER